MHQQIINLSQTGIVVCLFVIVGYAAVDLVPCDKSRRVFTDSWGVITDGPVGSNYTQDSHCEWLIKANSTNKYITLSFRSMGTECSYDYVFVYDGDSFRSPLLGSFSGKTEPQQVTATSGYMLILLYSDTNYVLDGFRAEFSITDCPNNCSGNGICFMDKKNKCFCNNDWGGFDCSKKLCPDDCNVARGLGVCQSGKCVCNRGYSGQSCSLPDYDDVGNRWHWLSHSESGLTARAAHTAVYVKATDSLYVFGGTNLNNVLGNLEIYSFLNSTWHDEYGRILVDNNVFHAIDPASVPRLFAQAGTHWQEKWGLKQGHSFLKNLLYAAGDNGTFTKRKQRHSQRPDRYNRPAPRYGHAACNVRDGFVVYGGKVENGSLSNELWLYDVYRNAWELRARSSTIEPPPLTRHSLTTGNEDDVLYLFGGSTTDGEFSSRLFKIELQDDGLEEWQEIKARGGKELDVRVVAHSTVYHAATNSLLVYGGIVAGVARFSKLSDRMFAFQLDERHWTEIHYTREHLRDRYVPRERAFHTANILGNYLIVFGGYSHRHNKEEICYDNQMYLYHLGCHTWVNPEILGKTTDHSRYPKQQGVFAHAACVRNSNTLTLVGGYHGNVNGDLLAYTVPPTIASTDRVVYDPEKACPRHKTNSECLADPECGYCSVDGLCYGRTVGANCTTNLQATRCPGICPALADCHSCLIHGGGEQRTGKTPLKSAAIKLGLVECTWCVQNARCHHKDDNYGVCGLREDSPSRMPGWWGAKGTEVVRADRCRELDRRPGLTFIRYHHPVNFSQPDHVMIINATTVDYSNPINMILKPEQYNGKMVARLMGFLRPPSDWQEMLKVCVSFCNATLKIDGKLLSNITAEQRECQPQRWIDAASSNASSSSSSRVSVDFESQKYVTIGGFNSHLSKMELQHHREKETPKVFTFEYLEPYANGTCEQYRNCLHCLTDSQCGWCELTNLCVSRVEDEQFTCVDTTNTTGSSDWRYLTLQPSACSNCSNYISCESCVETGLCEWRVDEAKCSRIGLSPESAISPHQCPTPCYQRTNCSACLEQQRGRCVWCEATQQCFSFSVYTSEYQFGLCREWLDQVPSFVPSIASSQDTPMAPRPQEQCKSCSLHANCSSCLSSLSCGWCYNSSNPISGVCVQGDFNNPHVNCSEALGGGVTNARWAYAQCPDVDECGLGIDDCHADAICINTDGSFSCHCRRGYKGDGRHYCDRTCYNDCVHGICSDKPLYTCNCDLGWTGDDCSINCGCNNHSACTKGVGKCDECQNWTTGEHCEFCQSGSYGNATTHEGCHPCQCNGHGNAEHGECHNVTGICYCIDNTEGNQCERCKPNYIGNPTNGKKCYYQCEARGVLYDTHGQGISSVQEYSTKWSGTPTRECLWIINPATEKGSPVIQFEIIPSEFKVTCGDNAVYVYDGLPDIGSQSTLAAVFCDSEPSPSTVIESRSGQLTVHYKKGFSKDQGFNASYTVLSCDNCPPSRKCRDDVCVCNDGFVGTRCDEAICPQNCSGRGTCDLSYGRCHCPEGWGGVACDIRLKNDSQLIFTELFNTLHLTESLEHLRKTLPRFGHSLSADRRGSLWMFGGYSLSHGPLNDIRLFDTRNTTWMQVTVDSTPEARMPQGRYFHGADIVHSRQAIYVYGGLTRTSTSIVTFDSNNRTLDDFWQFDIQNQRWREIERDSGKTNEWPPSVAGHTLTSYRNASVESLILVGGMAPPYGFLNVVWEYRLDVERWERWRTRGKGPTDVVGHSAVFHQPTNSLYVFGGIVRGERITNKLYALNYDTRTWTDMNVFMPSESDIILPKPRFFHSAVTTDSYMVIFGGRLEMANSTEILYAYSYNCNQWINLLNETDWIGPLPRKTYAQAMTIDADGSAVYVIGGWTGDTKCNVYKIQIPKNLCSLWPNRLCLTVPDCAYCAIKLDDEIKKETCYGIAQECPLEDVVNYTKNTNQARTCTGQLLANCRDLQDCSTCLQVSECQWCNDTCTSNKTCQSYTSTTSSLECSLDLCPATDCIQCHQMEGCTWTGELCVPVAEMRADRTEIATCNLTCAHFTTCSSCLNDKIDCRWSTQLNECFDPAYVPILYVGGVSGLVLNPREKQHCPEPCDSFDQCSTCLKHFHCGWCSVPSSNGQGLCTDGSNDRPLSGSCERVMANRRNIINLNDEIAAASNNTYSWYYVKCPPEDECSNDHHNCARNSEVCVDLEEGFECVCGPGYKAGSTGCEPVCSQGCVRGQCVEPDKCQCDFGYVGANCSIQCQCNGHANCEGPDRLDQCLTCHNNTMGAQCEKCKPLYVGDPSNGGQCVPCLEYCNGHTDVCVGGNVTESDLPEDFEELAEFFKEGPKDSARCIRCGNRTTGIRCDDCITGNFRGFEDHRKACRPCDCHGHGDTCDPVTGEKCNCKNNTESDSCPSGSSKNSAQQCWMVQCSKCKEGYLGTPKAGHQCYKQLNMDAKMCFDAKPIDECKIKPRPLHPGETVFFAIQPRFMNVDIRIMIDVTQGKLNVYMSQHDDTYVVYPNASTGFQQIDLDSKYGQFENGSYKTDDVLLERDAEGLRTYITVTQPKTMLAVKGLSDRLVITLPEEYHCLDTNRFYIVLQALEPEDTDKKVAYGIIFFRQDQLHIDLFVFFSVFFSCFFLFLAACVVAWKAKQAADVRRARRRHVVEMLHMAKRPFASVTLNLSTRPKPRTRSIHHDLRPVAVEPTDDGLAAVATIFVSLPGGQNTTVKLALASSLILLARQYPSGSRAFLRRRSMPLPPPT